MIVRELCSVLADGSEWRPGTSESHSSADMDQNDSAAALGTSSRAQHSNPDAGFSTHETVSQQGNPMAVQSVFQLLDTLEKWAATCTTAQDEPRFIARVAYNAGVVQDADRINQDSSFAIKMRHMIRKFVEAIPKELLGQSAMRIKAYARAMRYFETHAREQHRLVQGRR